MVCAEAKTDQHNAQGIEDLLCVRGQRIHSTTCDQNQMLARRVQSQEPIETMRKVKLDEAQKQLSQLVDDAVSGEDIVISRGDGADVQLVPVVESRTRPRKGGGLKGLFVVPDDFGDPLPDFESHT